MVTWRDSYLIDVLIDNVHNARLQCGTKWLVYDNEEWKVYQRQPYQKYTRCLYSGELTRTMIDILEEE